MRYAKARSIVGSEGPTYINTDDRATLAALRVIEGEVYLLAILTNPLLFSVYKKIHMHTHTDMRVYVSLSSFLHYHCYGYYYFSYTFLFFYFPLHNDSSSVFFSLLEIFVKMRMPRIPMTRAALKSRQ